MYYFMIFSPLILFKVFLSISIFFALSSMSSISLWISLEMNMLSFLPIMSSEGIKSLENSMKYFLIQSLASVIFLIVILLSNMVFMAPLELVMTMALLMKLGAAPFHNWFVSLLSYVSIWIYFFLSSIQKIIPLVILSSINMLVLLFFFTIFFNFFVIFISSLSSMSLMKILAYSSINNLSWMLFSIFYSLNVMFIFLVIYMWLLMGLLLIFSGSLKIMFSHIISTGALNKFMLVFIFMSLGGLPPFLGFLGKVMVIKYSILFMSTMIMLVVIFSSLIILYLYISFSFIMLSMTPGNMLISYKINFSNKSALYLTSLLSFPMLVIYFI